MCRSCLVFELISPYRPDLIIDWHYNEAHHGKEPIDRIGGTVKNFVLHQVKLGQVIINSAEDIEEVPIIPETLKIHKFT